MDHRLLRTALTGNAIFSAISGGALIALAMPLSSTFEVPPLVLVVIGAGLLPFAAMVAGVARMPERRSVLAVIAADVGWVVSAIGILVLAGGSMATAAVVALGAVTVVVGDFAVLQWVGLRTLEASA